MKEESRAEQGRVMKIKPAENGVPVPSLGKYGFLDDLKVGESAVVADVNFSSLFACMCYRQKRYGKKFARRAVEGGFRVWRVK
jgi:hypothetical protein